MTMANNTNLRRRSQGSKWIPSLLSTSSSAQTQSKVSQEHTSVKSVPPKCTIRLIRESDSKKTSPDSNLVKQNYPNHKLVNDPSQSFSIRLIKNCNDASTHQNSKKIDSDSVTYASTSSSENSYQGNKTDADSRSSQPRSCSSDALKQLHRPAGKRVSFVVEEKKKRLDVNLVYVAEFEARRRRSSNNTKESISKTSNSSQNISRKLSSSNNSDNSAPRLDNAHISCPKDTPIVIPKIPIDASGRGGSQSRQTQQKLDLEFHPRSDFRGNTPRASAIEERSKDNTSRRSSMNDFISECSRYYGGGTRSENLHVSSMPNIRENRASQYENKNNACWQPTLPTANCSMPNIREHNTPQYDNRRNACWHPITHTVSRQSKARMTHGPCRRKSNHETCNYPNEVKSFVVMAIVKDMPHKCIIGSGKYDGEVNRVGVPEGLGTFKNDTAYYHGRWEDGNPAFE